MRDLYSDDPGYMTIDAAVGYDDDRAYQLNQELAETYDAAEDADGS